MNSGQNSCQRNFSNESTIAKSKDRKELKRLKKVHCTTMYFGAIQIIRDTFLALFDPYQYSKEKQH